jgi:uncharacterized RDD family membrane protein YckC
MIAEVSGTSGAGSRIKEWHCAFMGQVEGPYGEEQLRSMIRSGRLTDQTFVWNSEPGNAEKGWVKACDTELASLFMENISLSPVFPALTAWKEPSLQLSASGAQYEEAWSAPVPRLVKPMTAKAESEERIATLKARFLAFVTDLLISSVMMLLAMIICGCLFSLAHRMLSMLDIYVDLIAYDIWTFIALPMIGILIVSLINIVIISRNSRTYGKKILGLRIVSASGRKLSLSRNIIIRSLVKLAPIILLIIAIYLHIFFWPPVNAISRSLVRLPIFVPLLIVIDLCFLLRKDRRTLHDIIGGTIVVNSK